MRKPSDHHQHDPDIIECRECGTQFDLARQYYYSPLCPSCEERDAEYNHVE